MSVTVRTLEEIYDDMAVASRDLAAARAREAQAQADVMKGEQRTSALHAEMKHHNNLQVSLRMDRLREVAR